MKLLRVVEWAGAAAVGALAWLSPAAAQSPPPLPNPDLGLVVAGTVSAVARQADGGLVIGGNFTLVDGQPRGNIARIRPDGTLDPNWHPQVANTINALAVNPASGAVYIGGFLTAVDGVPRSRLARLDGATGALDAGWDPAPNSTVNALAVDPVSGAVFAGGAFASFGTPAVARVGIAKIDGATGALDATWTPAASNFSSVNAIVLSSTGAVYAGGTFTAFTGAGAPASTPRNYLAKLDATSGALDADWNPTASASVSALALDAATGDVYAGGNFTTIGVPAVARQRLAKIAGGGIGAIDATFSAAAASSVYALALDPAANKLYVGGAFTTLTGSGDPAATPRLRLGKLDAITGALDAAWNPAASGNVNALVSVGANTIVAGGNFGTIGTTTRLSLAALATADGALAASVDVGTRGTVATIARQSNGGFIVGGNFLKAGNAPRTHLLRLNPDGTLDPNFKPLLSGNVSNVAIGAGDAVYPTGFFTTIDGVARGNIARLDAAGTVDPNWSTTLSGPAATMAENGGWLYIGGTFTTIGGANHARLARLDAATAARDAAWMPSPTGPVNAIAIDAANGMLFAGGGFQAVGGQNRAYLAKLDLATGTATAWNPIVNSSVTSIALSNGALYAGGAFVTATVGGTAGVARSKLIKIDAATGDVDAAWNPGSSTNVVALAADGNALYVSAGSGTVGGQTRAYLSKIDANGSANALWNPSPNAQVNAFAFGAGGAVFVGGQFTAVGGAPRLVLAALPNGVPSTTTIDTVLPATTVVGESYDVAVSVSVPGATASGNVAVDDGNGATCTATLTNGAGSCTLVSTAAGTRTITASHTSPDYLPSSATATHVVERASTTTAFGAATPTTAVYGDAVAAGFALSVNAPGAGTPGGDVGVTVDGAAGCTAPVAAGACTLAASSLTAGTHALVAAYAGDANFTASASASQMLTIAKAPTTTTLVGATPATTGQPVTVGYAVAGAGAVTGDVSVIASSGETCTATVASGQCAITFATAGARTLTATYTGDANHDGSTSAALPVAVGDAEVWVEGQKLTPSDGTNGGYFGTSAAVRGDVALVGSPNMRINGVDQRGAVYVFKRINGTWTQAQKLLSSDGTAQQHFGSAIAIEGDTALIGAEGSTVSNAAGAGAVYVFTEADGTWTQTQKLVASDPYPGANFGRISMSGDRAAIGAGGAPYLGHNYQGAVYVFTRTNGTWAQTQKLVAADGATLDYFGANVAIDGGTIAVASNGADIAGVANRGAVYVYTESTPGQWSLAQKLTASDGVADSRLGSAVALSGANLLVGTSSTRVAGLAAAGAAYMFTSTDGVWSETQKLVSPNLGAYYNFGYRAMLRGDTGFIGEPYATVGGAAQRGAVHAIRKQGAQWSITSTITASDGVFNNWFGWAIGWDGSTAVIGAMGVNYMPNAYQGAVYFFRPDSLFDDGFE
ncbi:Ig-like domain repeat protein [Tahibacter soli]|uniref:Ig-like domain repeat protein n=1 Tax=Tahibacter soli TaxID=2983605 RepID=A0A9X3YNJ3_9GAMM|nr:Ig-like domain repeat protein [Tahibacter soli]MDC8015019.1 Ig-like domain repeat protein [Tahibacter soli]